MTAYVTWFLDNLPLLVFAAGCLAGLDLWLGRDPERAERLADRMYR